MWLVNTYIFLVLKEIVNIYFLYLFQVLIHGRPGEEVSLELILRVVADVGLVVSTPLYSSKQALHYA